MIISRISIVVAIKLRPWHPSNYIVYHKATSQVVIERVSGRIIALWAGERRCFIGSSSTSWWNMLKRKMLYVLRCFNYSDVKAKRTDKTRSNIWFQCNAWMPP